MSTVEKMTFQSLGEIREHKPLRNVSRWLEAVPSASLFRNVYGGADSFIAADIFKGTNRPVVVVTDSSRKAEVLAEECRGLVGEENVALLPSRDPVPYNMKSPFGPTTEARLRVLGSLLDSTPAIFITPAVSLLQRVLPPRELFNRIVHLEVGAEIPIEQLSAWLIENGFRKEQAVADVGSFSVRGGIVDIYPFMSEEPVRLEFWGDQIESIRQFDVFSQKSIGSLRSIDVYPMREFCISDKEIESALDDMRLTKGGELETSIQKLEHQWIELGDHEGIEWFLHWFDLPSISVLDYFPKNSIILWDDLLSPSLRFDDARANYTRHLERVPKVFADLISSPKELLHAETETIKTIETFCRIYLETKDLPSDLQVVDMQTMEQPALPPQVESLCSHLQAQSTAGFDSVIVSANIGNAERLYELIHESCPQTRIVVGVLHKGFGSKAERALWYSESQFFHRHVRTPRRGKAKGGLPIPGFDALSPGDFVVHVDHGIARFIGVQRIEADRSPRDCMVLGFENRAKLYVPVEDFHKVQKYVAKESAAPTLSKLGSASWDRLKTRTKESLREMAEELIQLYAKRQHLEGITFSEDSYVQKEFEDSFLYEPTADQERAIEEVKKDMRSSKPMDRLICGDVGFGKTEVAMRAAFKAVNDGYQVAVLAPTTILAMQHQATFSERMAGFPVNVEVLCRFLKPKQEKQVIEKIKMGKSEILIGTHRILSKDVEFKNLGLLIIDEEQKFGVRHKERLKQLRSKIDVLSMTATPIPRTLHMSLIGARDLSIISTPPQNRLPVETVVSEFHDEMVKTAIENELDRGGQVYVVHNRVKNLEIIADRIEQLVPRARVAMAHGQMHERELETIMRQFVAGKFDVLVSTVIIENGLDITNVNTVIVNRADALGLSQLYQLRGRVGRSSEQAYAYLLTPPFRQVDETSLRRLHALEQYTELGSGFQIAMRDMEIRGAGDVLGTRQHGFIAAVGFELYCRLLEEAVAEVRGEEPKEEVPPTQVEIGLDAYIPSEYVSESTDRVRFYQQLSSADDTEGVEDVENEFVDRFGPIPEPVQNLLLLMQIRTLARHFGCTKVKITDEGMLLLIYEGSAEKVRDRIGKIITASKTEFEIIAEEPVALKCKLKGRSPRDFALQVRALLEQEKPQSVQG